MPLEYTFRCPLANGLHARPASHLAEAVARYKSDARLANLRSGVVADAASVLDLVSAGVLHDDPCVLCVDGVDEAEAFTALSAFIADVLPGCDAPLPEGTAPVVAGLPRVLEGEALSWLAGTPVSPGIGIGRVVAAAGLRLPAELPAAGAMQPQAERRKLAAALAAVTADLEVQLGRAANATERDILRATLALARDALFQRQMHEQLDAGGCTAAQAVLSAVRRFAERLEAAGSAYLRERAADLQDIGLRLLEQLGGGKGEQQPIVLTEPSVLAAPSLGPGQFLALERGLLRGLVLADVGATAHVVILARSFGIPVVTGVQQMGALAAGQEAIVDAHRGLVVTPVTEAARRFYVRELVRDRMRQARWGSTVHAPARTRNGWGLEVAANIATAAEATAALEHGADGIGLFRTEMLFAGRDAPPTEDEQFAIYKAAVQAMQGRSVIIRTLDVGGDKALPYLNLPPEANPFLGYRGVRIYEGHAEIIDTQLRAIVRASGFGQVSAMAPMVGALEEARAFRARVAGVQAELAAQKVDFDPGMRVGIMLEVPSAALIVDQLSTVVDFFSIGSNDLCQYLLAVDRDNRQVAGLFNEREPAFLRLLKLAADEAHRHGKWIGLCGEMAREIMNLPLLVGLGLDEISLAVPGIPAMKSALGELTRAECREVLEAALACESAAGVDKLLSQRQDAGDALPLLSSELILLNSDSRSKAEAIKELCDMFYVAGRCDAPDALEDAVWAREAAFSTGLGYGFAIPHCKTDSVRANSLGLLKLAQPVEWGSLDDLPVTLVLLLVVRESAPAGEHLKLFARLARKLMHEEFRAALLGARENAEMLSLLSTELRITEEEV
jgi:fructose-specific PTS system IIA-like component